MNEGDKGTRALAGQSALTISAAQRQLLAAPLFKIPTPSGLDNALILGCSEPQSTLFTSVQFLKNKVEGSTSESFSIIPALYWPNTREFSLFSRCVPAAHMHGRDASQRESIRFFLGRVFRREASEGVKNRKRRVGTCKQSTAGSSSPDKLLATEASNKTPRTRFAKPFLDLQVIQGITERPLKENSALMEVNPRVKEESTG